MYTYLLKIKERKICNYLKDIRNRDLQNIHDYLMNLIKKDMENKTKNENIVECKTYEIDKKELLNKMPFCYFNKDIDVNDYSNEELGELFRDMLAYAEEGIEPKTFSDKSLKVEFRNQLKAMNYGAEQYISKVVGGRKGGLKIKI